LVSIPELLPENGDFTSEQAEILNIDLGPQIQDAIFSEGSKGVQSGLIPDSQSVQQAVSF
jgi:hypothetical protein